MKQKKRSQQIKVDIQMVDSKQLERLLYPDLEGNQA